MKEHEWDRLLGIRTMGRYDKHADDFIFPYEPTPYSVLERLLDSGLITKDTVLADYGCGKGRVSFFLARTAGIEVIGVEHNERMYRNALENLASFSAKDKVTFRQTRAEEWVLPDTVNSCYFFNPFSEVILKKVLDRILDSYYDSPRLIRLFFYYPSLEYLLVLTDIPELEYEDDIDCTDLFQNGDPRERVLVFAIHE